MYAFLIVFSGCTFTTQPQDEDKSLNGTWQWTGTSGGIDGRKITPESAGYSMKIVIEEDSRISFFRNDSLQCSCNFQIRKGKSIYSSDSTDFISYSCPIQEQVIISEADTLELRDNYYDGFASRYIRRK